MDPLERIARTLWLRDTSKGQGSPAHWPEFYTWYLREVEKGTGAAENSLIGRCVDRARAALALIEEAGCKVVVCG